MRRIAAYSLLVLALLASAPQSAAGISAKRLSLKLNNVPFPEVIRQIFSTSKQKYSVDPALGGLKVTATMKNVSRDQAIRVVTKTAGVDCTLSGNVYRFRPKPQVLKPNPDSTPASTSRSRKTDIITLRYIGAGDAASYLNAAPPNGLISITATSANMLLLTGSASSLHESESLIALLDVESALPRSVRITLTLKIDSAVGLPVVVTAESVGREGDALPIAMTSTGKNSYDLSAVLTPNVLSEESVSLSGSGNLKCAVMGPVQQQFSTKYEVAASATSGAPIVIASGSADEGQAKVEFSLSATVNIENGRVLPRPTSAAPSHGGSATASKAPLVTIARPDEAHRKAADAILARIWRAAPNRPKFDAVDAVVRKYHQSDLASRNAIIWLSLTYMKDKNRGPIDRWPCCYVISHSGYEKGIPDLIDVLQHDRLEVMRAVAAEALGAFISNASARDAMLQAAKTDASEWVKSTIARYINSASEISGNQAE